MSPPIKNVKTSHLPPFFFFFFLICFYRILSVDTCTGSHINQSDFYSSKIIDLLFRVNKLCHFTTDHGMPQCSLQKYISSGVSHSDGSCVLGRVHSDVSSNIPKKVYHIVTDNFVNLLHISYAWLYKTECWGRKFHALVLIHTGIVKYLWQILILYSIKFAYPTYSGSPFSDEIAIMIRHYVIHPYLKIRHYVIHPTI